MPVATATLPKSKKCIECGLTKPLVQFAKHAGYGSTGYEARCKPCHAKKRRERRGQKNPEDYGPPKAYHQLTPQHKAMLESTPEAFEAFFNEFAHEQGQLPRHAKDWARHALENQYLLLNVPPRHAKTTLMAIWFPIWQFARSRDTQVLIVSKTVKLGQKIARKIAFELEYNRKLNLAFGRFRPEDTQRKWSETAGELELEGKNLAIRSGDLNLQIRGSGQAILGMEADWIVADDITDRAMAVSEIKSVEESEYFHGEMMTRLSPDGKVFCIGQRVHSNDLYGKLARERDEDGTPIWNLVKTPAILMEDLEAGTGEVLWPEVWTYEKMREKRKAIGTSLFACMYQQTPEVSGDFVPRWWIVGNGEPETPGCLDRDRSVGIGWPAKHAEGGFIPITRVVSVDPSPTQYAAIVVADVVYQLRSREFWCSIVDIRRDKMGLRKMVDTIGEVQQKYRPQVCIFESNSVKWLKEDPTWNRLIPLFQTVVDHSTGVNKRHTELGVWSLAADFEAGRIRFPWADAISQTTSNYLIDEVLAYPNGMTDDVLMALWFIKYNYRSLMPRDFLPTSFSSDWTHGRGEWRHLNGK